MQSILAAVLGFIANVWFWLAVLFVKFKVHKPKEFEKAVRNEIDEFNRYGKYFETMLLIIVPIFLLVGAVALFAYWRDPSSIIVNHN